MRRAAMMLIGFGYAVLLIEALRAASAWYHGEIESFGLTEWLLIAALPVLAWVWWRHLSPFGKGRGQCLLPEEPDKPKQE